MLNSTYASLSERLSNANVPNLSMYCASIALALFTFAYMLRGGALLFGSINLTPVFLLLTIACAAVHIIANFLATGKIRFQLIWADLALVGLALLMLVNRGSEAGMDKSARFIALVLVPYFLARYILVDFGQVKRFLYTALAIITVIALGGFASYFLPQPIAGLLPYQSSEWAQRLIFAQANPIAVGMAIMIGMMVYVGIAAGRGRISWAIPCLVITGIMLYTLLLVGTRGAIVASFGALIVAIVAALATRRFKELPVLIIALCGVGFIFYNAFAGALVPEPQPEPQPEPPPAVAAAQEAPTPTQVPTPTAAPPAAQTQAAAQVQEPTPTPEPKPEPTPEPTPIPTPEPEPEPTAPPIQLPRVELPNQDRFDTLVDATTISGWTSEDTLKNRVVLFREAIAMFRENPILGAGATGMEIDGASGLEIYAHNIFLETAGELGIVGLALLAVAIAFILRSLWKLFITMDQEHPNYYIVLAAFMALTGLFIQKQFSTNLASHKDIVAFAAIILNLPILLNIPASAVELSGLRSKLPPQLRFLAPAKDSVPIDDADEPSA